MVFFWDDNYLVLDSVRLLFYPLQGRLQLVSGWCSNHLLIVVLASCLSRTNFIPEHFITCKTHFLILAGTEFHQIWWKQEPPNRTMDQTSELDWTTFSNTETPLLKWSGLRHYSDVFIYYAVVPIFHNICEVVSWLLSLNWYLSTNFLWQTSKSYENKLHWN